MCGVQRIIFLHSYTIVLVAEAAQLPGMPDDCLGMDNLIIGGGEGVEKIFENKVYFGKNGG